MKKADIFTETARRTALLRGYQDDRLNANLTLEELSLRVNRSVAYCDYQETDCRSDITPIIIQYDQHLRATGTFNSLNVLARVHNFALFPLPTITPKNTDLMQDASNILIETSGAIGEIGKALADGKITAAEFVACKIALRNAVEAIIAAEANIDMKAKEDAER